MLRSFSVTCLQMETGASLETQIWHQPTNNKRFKMLQITNSQATSGDLFVKRSKGRLKTVEEKSSRTPADVTRSGLGYFWLANWIFTEHKRKYEPGLCHWMAIIQGTFSSVSSADKDGRSGICAFSHRFVVKRPRLLRGELLQSLVVKDSAYVMNFRAHQTSNLQDSEGADAWKSLRILHAWHHDAARWERVCCSVCVSSKAAWLAPTLTWGL